MNESISEAVKSGKVVPAGQQSVQAGLTSTDISAFGYTINLMSLFIVMMLVGLILLLFKAQRNRRLDWVDMITRDGRTISLTRILQLVGGVVGTWIVLTLTMAGTMSWEILIVYLAYVASIEGFSKFVQAKYGPIQSQGQGGEYGDFRPTDGRGAPTVNVGVQYNSLKRPGPPLVGRRPEAGAGGHDPSFSGAAKTPEDTDR